MNLKKDLAARDERLQLLRKANEDCGYLAILDMEVMVA